MTAVSAVEERWGERWDDGLIARRAAQEQHPPPGAGPEAAGEPHVPIGEPYAGTLRARLDALRELVGLSRARLDGDTLAEAGRVLDEAAARQRLSARHTVVAIAGPTGSGKSTLINALARVPVSETGLRRPTTSHPIACSWSEGAAGLLDRLAIPGRLRLRPLAGGAGDEQFQGLVLIDLPDHDSAVIAHRRQVDRVLGLVDAVIWVVDPEKYADAALHERYLRPLAGHADVSFVVLNQIDRLPGDAAHQVLDDLRRLLDEDGMALGEHGEPGAAVLAVSALTGEGMPELRELLAAFVQGSRAAERRLSADVDAAAARLRPVYVAEGGTGLGERAREDFAARLAVAVGAQAAGESAERSWRRNAGKACGTPWLRLWRWGQRLRTPGGGEQQPAPPAEDELTARQRVEQAVRLLADDASRGLPRPWAQAVREAALRGAEGLPEALDQLAAETGAAPAGGRPPRPAWWPAAVLAQCAMTLLQFYGALWLVGQIVGFLEPGILAPALIMLGGILGGPLVEWACVAAARGPARRYGQETERRLRDAAAACGRARVLDPITAELSRYREVREQYAAVSRGRAGGPPLSTGPSFRPLPATAPAPPTNGVGAGAFGGGAGLYGGTGRGSGAPSAPAGPSSPSSAPVPAPVWTGPPAGASLGDGPEESGGGGTRTEAAGGERVSGRLRYAAGMRRVIGAGRARSARSARSVWDEPPAASDGGVPEPLEGGGTGR
ncbi:GTPase [Streptomyces lichenis]|uniref:50S ribosome-binding GTPase n=1 Tax=Streptomyces lichenis TaxID=2306967 RepID=A0ABT0I655_9ACTN|nr:50S ribosome-binding GTPase [Streptomyces lichenis]